MAFLKFLDSKDILQCVVKKISSNVISLSFADKIVVDTSGFHLYMDAKCENDIGGTTYEKFKTIYRNDEETDKSNGYQLSNNGSTYEKPTYTVKFLAGSGGELDGIAEQSVETYEELVVPEPVTDTNYSFVGWNPEIPKEGNIVNNESYTALFEYVPTAEEIAERERQERITEINEEIAELKERLAETDYQIIKTYEYSLVGKESEYDIYALHEQREEHRKSINELEAELTELNE